MTDENRAFERDKAAYNQHSESFRSLNTQMWQVPIISMTLTGGLWFGIASSSINDYAAGSLFLFASICNILFIFILKRVRFIMELIIEKLTEFNPKYAINPKKSTKGTKFLRQDKLVISIFSIMLILSSSLSFTAFVYKFWPWLFN